MKCKAFSCNKRINNTYGGTQLCIECYWFIAFYNGGLRGEELFNRVIKAVTNLGG